MEGRFTEPSEPLPADFYTRSSLDLAPLLLNKVLVVGGGSQRAAGRIVEVEAYDQSDPASHSYRGPTPRCEVMFGRAGRLYVYRSYGIHWCANVVCDVPGHGAAVLLRALEPLAGIECQRQRRGAGRRRAEGSKGLSIQDLCSGPGKLCQAMAITGEDNEADLVATDSRVRLFDDGTQPPAEPRRGPRIGISKAVEQPWRFWVDGNRHVSRPWR